MSSCHEYQERVVSLDCYYPIYLNFSSTQFVTDLFDLFVFASLKFLLHNRSKLELSVVSQAGKNQMRGQLEVGGAIVTYLSVALWNSYPPDVTFAMMRPYRMTASSFFLSFFLSPRRGT